MYLVPLSEDEQRVLDEIERQLRGSDARFGDTRTRRVADKVPVESSGPSPFLLGVACLGGLVALVLGVLIGGVAGVPLAWLGFVWMIVGGVGFVHNSQAAIANQLHLLANRYAQGPQGSAGRPSSGQNNR
jgi:Protein of unknown function (DUF3040)